VIRDYIIIPLDVFQQWHGGICIEELTEGAIRRKRHDNLEEAYVGGNDPVGWEDVGVQKLLIK